MIEIIEGNLFDTDAKFICHQVNCMGKMGSGVALQVRQRFPHVYEEYTSLEALEKCFRTMYCKAHERNNNFSATIAMPYKIGCDRGGADWDEVYSMMQKIFNELDTHVELWKLNQ